MLKQKGDITISLQSFLLSCTWFSLICFHHVSFLNSFSETTLEKDNLQNTVPPSINWHGCRRESKWVHIHEIVDGRVSPLGKQSHVWVPQKKQIHVIWSDRVWVLGASWLDGKPQSRVTLRLEGWASWLLASELGMPVGEASPPPILGVQVLNQSLLTWNESNEGPQGPCTRPGICLTQAQCRTLKRSLVFL